jgi:hypothetical protein
MKNAIGLGRWVGRRGWWLASLVVLFAILAPRADPQEGRPAPGVSQPKPPKEARKQWEYEQVPVCPTAGADPEDPLNREGERGWELVTLTARPPSVRPDCYLAIFKRERVR